MYFSIAKKQRPPAAVAKANCQKFCPPTSAGIQNSKTLTVIITPAASDSEKLICAGDGLFPMAYTTNAPIAVEMPAINEKASGTQNSCAQL